MKAFRALWAALFYGTVLLLLACGSHQRAFADTFSGRCCRVLDGDTIEVLHDGTAQRIRLSEIDCPEKQQSFGQDAKRFTSNLALGKCVVIDWHKKDRYGRTIGKVTLPDGQSLNAELVRNGYAWWYRKYSVSEDLAHLEEQARAAHAGLWQDSTAIPPWQFRHALRAHVDGPPELAQ